MIALATSVAPGTGPGFAGAFFLLTAGGPREREMIEVGEVLLVIILALLVVTVLGVLVRRA